MPFSPCNIITTLFRQAMAGILLIAPLQTGTLDGLLTAHLQSRLIIIISHLWEAVLGWVHISHGRPLRTPQDLSLGLQDEHTRLSLLGRLLPPDFRQTPGLCHTSTC